MASLFGELLSSKESREYMSNCTVFPMISVIIEETEVRVQALGNDLWSEKTEERTRECSINHVVASHIHDT
jgi:hypothetical protein